MQLSLFMDDTRDDELESMGEREMRISALHRYHHDLCIGTISRNIMKFFEASKNMPIRKETIRVSSEIMRYGKKNAKNSQLH